MCFLFVSPSLVSVQSNTRFAIMDLLRFLVSDTFSDIALQGYFEKL